jgi:glycosyltransferase involved in cell wall biosynthesis
MSVAAPEVSVIVPARDAKGSLARLLDALTRQTLADDRFEVIVVDDGSRDGTGSVPGGDRRQDMPLPEVIRLRSPGPVGAYAARNLGLAKARGDVVAFTDADCRPVPEWLECGLAALSSSGADLVAGRIEVPIRSTPSIAELLDASRHLHQEFLVRLGFGATANLFVRNEVLRRLGGFNDGLPRNGDRELCMRAAAAGFRLTYEPTATVVHDPRRRARDLVRQAYATGVGRALTEARGSGPARRWQSNWLRPADYFPASLRGRPPLGIERLHAQGHRPSRTQRALMQLAWYGLVGLPLVAGYALCRATGARLWTRW